MQGSHPSGLTLYLGVHELEEAAKNTEAVEASEGNSKGNMAGVDGPALDEAGADKQHASARPGMYNGRGVPSGEGEFMPNAGWHPEPAGAHAGDSGAAMMVGAERGDSGESGGISGRVNGEGGRHAEGGVLAEVPSSPNLRSSRLKPLPTSANRPGSGRSKGQGSPMRVLAGETEIKRGASPQPEAGQPPVA